MGNGTGCIRFFAQRCSQPLTASTHLTQMLLAVQKLGLLHGQVNDLKGLDLAVVGMSETQTTTGVNLGIFGASVNQEMTGASLGFFNWNTGKTTGLNLGAVNITNDVKVNVSFRTTSEGNTSG